MKAYNQWYPATYDKIFSMASWQDFTADVERKVVCVFSWMPQTIMNVRHPGKRKKSELFGVGDACEHVRAASLHFERVKNMELASVNLQDIRSDIIGSSEPIFALFGPSAGSKFLHFAAPRLFPMWESSLRKEAKLSKGSSGEYFQYMQLFQRELRDPQNIHDALTEYPGNPVRGWDIRRMKQREQEEE